jgi:hypothetical protein
MEGRGSKFYGPIKEESFYQRSPLPFVNKVAYKNNSSLLIPHTKTVLQKGRGSIRRNNAPSKTFKNIFFGTIFFKNKQKLQFILTYENMVKF